MSIVLKIVREYSRFVPELLVGAIFIRLLLYGKRGIYL